jgi:DNA invertase Pin-like site-specific DNA recombinase
MAILQMSEEERKRISEQHKKLEQIARDKKEELKKGLKKPEEKKKTTN